MDGEGGVAAADSSVRERLADVVNSFSFLYAKHAKEGALVQLWMPQGNVLTTKGSPFAILGCSDALALYKYESGKYMPTTDGANAMCPISRVFADLQPELPSPSSSGNRPKQQVEFDRVAEAQRAGIHSTLLLAMYDLQGSESQHCAVFELAQHEIDVDFSNAVNILNSVCQDSGFCVPQLESVCSVQSWQGAVEPPAPPGSGPELPPWLQQAIAQQPVAAPETAGPKVAAGPGPAAAAWAGQAETATAAAAAAAAAAWGGSPELGVGAASVISGDGEIARTLSKLGAVRRYSCMVAEPPAALLQFLDDADDCFAASAFQDQYHGPGVLSPGLSSRLPRSRRQSRRQSFIVTDYFKFDQLECTNSSRIGRTWSGFAPAAPACTPGKPGSLLGRRTSSGVESVSSLQSQRSGVSVPGSAGSLLSRRSSSGSGVDAAQLSALGSDASVQAPDTPASEAGTKGFVGPQQQQQQQQQPVLLSPRQGLQRTASSCSSRSCGSRASTSSTRSGASERRSQPPLSAACSLVPKLRAVASGASLCDAAASSCGGIGGASTASQQQQLGQLGPRQGSQGSFAAGSSLSHKGQLTNMWTSEGGEGKVVCLPRRQAFSGAATLQQHIQQQQQQQQQLQDQLARMSMGPSPTRVQLGAAAAKLLRVKSIQKPGTLARTASRAAPGIIAGTLTQEQAAGIHLGRLCGAGSFGRVYRGMLEGQDVAIKQIIHKRNNAQQIAQEVSMMMGFEHPHLVKAYHYVTWSCAGHSEGPQAEFACQEEAAPLQRMACEGGMPGPSDVYDLDGGSSESKITETWIISEFMNAGTLQDAVLERNAGVFFIDGVPQMRIMLQVLLGVAQGMEWLHARGILHGDLKGANVMLHAVPPAADDAAPEAAASLPAPSPSWAVDSQAQWAAAGLVLGGGSSSSATGQLPEPAVTLLPKITDFGMSRVISEGASHLSTMTMGTVSHQAPELMRSGRLSKQADVFSFGVLMWEAVMAAQPWKGKKMGEILNDVMNRGSRLRYGPHVPQQYKELAESCCLEDPALRPTFTQLVEALQGLLGQAEQVQQEAGVSFAEQLLPGAWVC